MSVYVLIALRVIAAVLAFTGLSCIGAATGKAIDGWLAGKIRIAAEQRIREMVDERALKYEGLLLLWGKPKTFATEEYATNKAEFEAKLAARRLVVEYGLKKPEQEVSK